MSALYKTAELASKPFLFKKKKNVKQSQYALEQYMVDEMVETTEREFRLVDTFGEEELMKVTGTADLDTVTELSLKVNTFDPSTTISELGVHLPHLMRLDLSGSLLQSFRDLGTSLRQLQVLKVEKSNISDLDGIGVLGSLEELHLHGNHLTDLTPLAMHDNLRYLDVSSNELADMNHVDQLGTCPRLRQLVLSHNPLCAAEKYRKIVCFLIPNLEELDKTLTTLADKESPAAAEVSRVLETTFESTGDIEYPDNSVAAAQEQDTAQIDRFADFRERQNKEVVISNSSNTEVIENRYTPLGRKIKAYQVQQEHFQKGAGNVAAPYSSALTHGDNEVYAGNLASSIRRRRRASVALPPKTFEDLDSTHVEGKSVDDLLKELQYWKDDLESNVAALQMCKQELEELPREFSETTSKTLRRTQRKGEDVTLENEIHSNAVSKTLNPKILAHQWCNPEDRLSASAIKEKDRSSLPSKVRRRKSVSREREVTRGNTRGSVTSESEVTRGDRRRSVVAQSEVARGDRRRSVVAQSEVARGDRRKPVTAERVMTRGNTRSSVAGDRNSKVVGGTIERKEEAEQERPSSRPSSDKVKGRSTSKSSKAHIGSVRRPNPRMKDEAANLNQLEIRVAERRLAGRSSQRPSTVGATTKPSKGYYSSHAVIDNCMEELNEFSFDLEQDEKVSSQHTARRASHPIPSSPTSIARSEQKLNSKSRNRMHRKPIA